MATATKARGGIVLATAELRSALATCGKVVSARAAKAILRNVRIGDGLITATDLEISAAVTCDYHGEPLLLPHDRLSAIVAACGADELRLQPGDTSCVVTAGRGRWTLPTEDVREFPAWEPADLKPVARLPSDQFARAVRGVAFAVDTESSRYALGAVLLVVEGGNPTLVATDGRRLATYECETDQAVDDGSWLVPARVMQLLGTLANGDDGSVQLEAAGSEIVATVANVTITARLMEGRFPRWRDVLVERDIQPTQVHAGELLAAVRQASIVVSEQSKGVAFAFSPDGITLTGRSSEHGESTVTCDVVEAGKATTVRMDPRFVSQWLATVDSAEVVSVEADTPEAAIVCRCEDSRYVIMPMAEE